MKRNLLTHARHHALILATATLFAGTLANAAPEGGLLKELSTSMKQFENHDKQEGPAIKGIDVVQTALAQDNIMRMIEWKKVEMVEGDHQSAQGKFDWTPSAILAVGDTRTNVRNDISALMGGAPDPRKVATNSAKYTSVTLGMEKNFAAGLKTELQVSPMQSKANFDKIGVPGVTRDMLCAQGVAPCQGSNTSSVTFKINVPLLKGSAWDDAYAPTVEEQVAKKNYEKGVSEYRQKVAEQVYAVMSAYWDYKAALKDRMINKISQDLVGRWVRSAKVAPAESRKGGRQATPSVNQKSLEAMLADETLGVTSAEQEVVAKKEALIAAMGISEDLIPQIGYPAEEFAMVPAQVNLDSSTMKEHLFKLAMENRADLVALRLEEESNNLKFGQAKNALKPQLDLETGVSYNGGGISQNTDGKTPETYSGTGIANLVDPMDDFSAGPSWNAMLTFKMPLGNNTAEGTMKKASAMMTLANMKQTSEYRKIISALRTTHASIKQRQADLATAEGAVKSYWEALDQSLADRGLSNPAKLTTILDLEEKLKKSMIAFNHARRDLAKAVVDARFHTGTLLAGKGADVDVTPEQLTTLP
ncbi:MAG: TolC family protein [Magnetococcales bacterium]|nr:TolC family protein [Magnetococcales bacterium]